LLSSSLMSISASAESLFKNLASTLMTFNSIPAKTSTSGISIIDAKVVGAEGKHLKMRLKDEKSGLVIDAIAFGMGSLFASINPEKPVEIAYTIDMNVWNNKRTIQLKIKDIHV